MHDSGRLYQVKHPSSATRLTSDPCSRGEFRIKEQAPSNAAPVFNMCIHQALSGLGIHLQVCLFLVREGSDAVLAPTRASKFLLSASIKPLT